MRTILIPALIVVPSVLCFEEAGLPNYVVPAGRSLFCDQHTDMFRIDTGANASAEEAEDALEDGEVKVNNVVNSFRLQSTSFDKKTYMSHLKGTCLYLFRAAARSYRRNGSKETWTY